MSDTIASLSRKISSAGDLQSVVRTMKALAASSVGPYEKSVSALGDYNRTVELGLGLCFRKKKLAAPIAPPKGHTHQAVVGAVVFGSDQGLVGQINDVVADFAIKTLAAVPWPTKRRPPHLPPAAEPRPRQGVVRCDFRLRGARQRKRRRRAQNRLGLAEGPDDAFSTKAKPSKDGSPRNTPNTRKECMQRNPPAFPGDHHAVTSPARAVHSSFNHFVCFVWFVVKSG